MIRRVEFKVFHPGNKTVLKKVVVRAPAGKQFSAQGVDQVLDRFCDSLDVKLRGHQYRMVPVGPAQFNFVWDDSVPAASFVEMAKAYMRRLQVA